MKNIRHFIFLAVLMGIHPFGCEEDGIDCGGGDASRYKIKTFYFNKINYQGSDVDHYYNDTNFFDTHKKQGFRLLPNVTERVSSLKYLGNPFIAKAVACSPLGIYTNTIQEFSIIAISDVDFYNRNLGDIRSGDTLNTIFQWQQGDYGDLHPIDFLYGKELRGNLNLLFKIDEANKDSVKLRFDINIRMNDGTRQHLPDKELWLLPDDS